MDVKLNDVLKCINTYQEIRLKFENGEERYPSYHDIQSYTDYYVTEIQADNDRIAIRVKSQI